MNLSLIYGVCALVSLLFPIAQRYIDKKKNIWLSMLFVSVFFCNVGYFWISVSKTVTMALWGNRIAYMGNVFLPFFVLMMIVKLCKIKISPWLPRVLGVINGVVLLITLSPGILPIYYKSVSLSFEDGATMLVKEYGPLHIYYGIFLLIYFVGMLAMIGYAIIKKTAVSQKHAIFLSIVVLGNLMIWFIEKTAHSGFEFLAISYLMTEGIILLLYSIEQDYYREISLVREEMENRISEMEANMEDRRKKLFLDEAAVKRFSEDEIEKIRATWEGMGLFSEREQEVLLLILQNRKRKDIADMLCVTESTIKKHTNSIYKKLQISDRAELYQLVRSYAE